MCGALRVFVCSSVAAGVTRDAALQVAAHYRDRAGCGELGDVHRSLSALGGVGVALLLVVPNVVVNQEGEQREPLVRGERSNACTGEASQLNSGTGVVSTQ